MEQRLVVRAVGHHRKLNKNDEPGVPDCSKHHLPGTATAHLMPTHAGHKHIILVQILKTYWASEHAVPVPLGAARGALNGTALCPCPWCPWHYS